MQEADQFKNLGNEEYKKGNYVAAVQFYSQAIEENPSESAYYGNRSAALYMLKNYRECIQDCLKAMEIDPNYTKVLMRAGKCSLLIGDLENAQQYYQRAIQLEPNNVTIQQEIKNVQEAKTNLTMADNSYSHQQYSNTVAFLQQAAQYISESTDLKIKIAKVMIEQGEYVKAQTLLSELIKLMSNNPEVVYYRGLTFYFTGQLEMAKKHFREALQLDPDFTAAREHFRLIGRLEQAKQVANEYFSSGDNDQAIQAYSDALEIDPSNKNFNSILLANRAAAYMKRSEYVQALEDCNTAIAYNPTYARAYLRRGNINTHLEEFEEALRDYNKAKELDPSINDIDNTIRFAQSKAKQAKRKDYYKILDIDKGASQDQIRKNYKKLALKWHPDKNSQTPEKRAYAEKMFKDIAEAYSVLSDENKRRQYDSGMSLDDIENGGMGGFSRGGGIDPTQIFSMFFGGGSPFDQGFGGSGFSQNQTQFGSGGFPFGFSQGGPGNVRFTFRRG